MTRTMFKVWIVLAIVLQLGVLFAPSKPKSQIIEQDEYQEEAHQIGQQEEQYFRNNLK